jgi:acyl-CoA thioester hydrolase
MSHIFETRVFYEDTDMGGIVYHANYLKFIERARSDWVAALGVDQIALRQAGTVFAVRRIEADFAAPARFGDRLAVETRLVSATPARAVLAQSVARGGAVLFSARVTIVAMSLEGRPARLPAAIRSAVT